MSDHTTIGLIGAGEMGAAIGRRLVAHGYTVTAVAAGRSSETRDRIREAGLTAVATLDDLVGSANVILSVVPSDAAKRVAQSVGDACDKGGRMRVFVDANAISPGLVREISAVFSRSPVTLVDAGIVGRPPDDGYRPVLYTSGPADALADYDGIAWKQCHLGPGIGQASAFKMTYASVTKGVNALLTNAMLGAESFGFLQEFVRELYSSQKQLAKRAGANVPRLPADAGRWIAEMREIARTYDDIDLPGDFHRGAAEIMKLLDDSRFGIETRRTRDPERSMEDTIRAIVADRRSTE